jgi:hypothetical protein
MEYKGTWDAATNTPTLADGTGNQGDVYLCNVAGTVNFGSGPISFVVGDQVIYSGTIWQKASGASGTVTSVAVTESGDALSITGSPITTSGTINIGFAGTSAQYVAGDGSLITFPTLTGYVPYTGATANVNLGTFDLTADIITGAKGSFASSGGSDTFAINHSSGSGIALNITKGGNGEGLYINKTSGSGNAATIIGTLNATTLVKNGGTSSEFLKADGSVDSSTYITLASLSATTPLSYNNTTGAFSISQANTSTSGFLSSTDWNTFNNKQNALTNPITGTGVSGRIPYFNGTTTQTSSANLTWDNTNSIIGTTSVLATTDVAAYNLTINGIDFGKIQNITGQSWGLAYGSSGASNALGSSALVWNTTGNVIIINKLNVGNYNNTYNLDITGTARISGQLNLGSTITNGTFTYTLPGATGTLALSTDLSSYVPTSRTLTINGTTYDLSADRSWTIAAGISGSGTTNYVPKFTSGTAIGDSLIYDNGTNVGIGTASPAAKLDINGGDLYVRTGGGIYGNTFGPYSGNMTISLGGSGNSLIVSGGAATFSSSVTIEGANSSIKSGNELRFYRTDNAIYTRLYDAGTYFALDNRNGNGFDFQSAGTSQMRISSAGNVGIGTSSPTTVTNYIVQTINGTSGSFTEYQQGGSYAFRIGSDSSLGGFLNQTDANPIRFFINNGERMRITSGGNVGIGTTSPSYAIDVLTSGAQAARFAVSGTNLYTAYRANSVDVGYIGNGVGTVSGGTATDFGFLATTNMVFATGSALERMRITSGGLVLIGTTSATGVDKVRINNDGVSSYSTVMITNANSTANLYVGVGGSGVANGNLQNNAYVWNASASALVFGTSDAARLTISSTGAATFSGGISAGTLYLGSLGTGTVYSSSGNLTNTNPSDKILKENITPITYGLNEILKLNPVSFDWKNDNNKNKQFGFIAQEVQEVMPEAVIDGEYLGLEKDAIYTALINAIKELEARLKTLENK